MVPRPHTPNCPRITIPLPGTATDHVAAFKGEDSNSGCSIAHSMATATAPAAGLTGAAAGTAADAAGRLDHFSGDSSNDSSQVNGCACCTTVALDSNS